MAFPSLRKNGFGTVTPILVLLLTVTTSLQSSETRRDGNWWRGQSEALKLGYMVGFFDGTKLGYNFSYWDFVHKDDRCLSKVRESYNSYRDKYLNNVTNDQIVDGLDAFYSDYRNRRIMVADAVWLVLNEVAGTPQKEMDQMIESWRKNAANSE